MNLQQAEEIAKAKMKEFFQSFADEVKSVSERMVFYSEKKGADWEVHLGLLPRDAQSFAAFKSSPDLDDSEAKRAKDWLKVTVKASGENAEVVEVNSFRDLV
jgi:hypothetical protein